ncbi:helix-turn-helix domain-containing protein [Glaciecola sp. SC05]|uniref:helix-turn-helix domain-containing protein n=1 Tax=Glaciecola sp. SC05 TaxID=1987355 RepID=UPI003526CB2D
MAEALSGVIENMVHSQYVVKDKKRYPSLYQTPLRDNLQVLRALSNELQQSTHFAIDSATPSNSIGSSQGVSEGIQKALASEQVLHDLLPAIKDYAETENINISVFEKAHGYINIRNGVAEKMLRELLLNAIKHNPAHTDIHFTCSFTKSHVVFEIKDDGVGIPAGVLNDAFAKSKAIQVNRSRRLSDAEIRIDIKTIAVQAAQLGGKLVMRSAINMGTHVRLLLPAAELISRPQYLRYKKPETSVQPACDSRKKVLVITKHSLMNDTLYRHLQNQYSVYCYASFDRALSALFEIKPDIVVADFSWQHALGIQFCQFLRGSSAMSQVPFVMVTMALDQAERVKMYASGVSAIIEKPLDQDELKTVLNNIVRNQTVFENEVKEACVAYTIGDKATETLAEQNEFISAFKKVITHNYQREAFNRFEASSALHISEKTLQRRMTAHFDMTFGQYLRKHRLKEGRKQLLIGKLITEVSFDVGFNSTSYFGQCFKEEFGYPPSMLSKAC